MVKMMSERFDMVFCGENYHDVFPREKLSHWKQPALCYFDTMCGWKVILLKSDRLMLNS